MAVQVNDRALANLKNDLALILGFTVVGDVKYPNTVLGQKHAVEWQSEQLPREGERGGSSSPRELEERSEDRRVALQAIRAEKSLRELLPAFHAELTIASYGKAPTPELMQVSERLARVLAWLVVPVDHGQLPKGEEPGCRSCHRLNTWKQWKGPRVWQPLSSQDRFAKQGLCSWCGKHGEPPIEAVAMRHREGEHKAGRWLAKQEAESQKACGQPTWTNGVEGRCGLTAMHKGRCTPVAESMAS